jgi:aspartate/methionine/tyrosine aminotransferase
MSEQIPSTLEKTLSPHGKMLYFPERGIAKQAEEATRELINSVLGINATAGVAYDDNGDLLTLPILRDSFVIEKNSFNYAPTAGIKELRETWKKEIYKKNPSLEDAPITLPIVTNGLTHGINIACQLFLAPEEKAILADKYWDNYELMVEMGMKGKLNTFPTFENGKYNIQDIERLALKEPIGKKFFIFNVPNNPTGYSPTAAEQDQIVEVLKQSAEAGNDVIVLCDDAYFGLAYDKTVAPESIFAKLAAAHDNIIAIKIDGATKEEFAWGLRVGFITIGGKSLSPKDIATLENKIAGAIRSNASNGNRPSQEAILRLLNHPNHDSEKAIAKGILQERFHVCKKTLLENETRYNSCFKPLPANSGYFLCLELQEGIDGEQVRKTLLYEHEIGIIALGNCLRIAFSAVNKERIPFLFEKIYEVCLEQKQ